MASSLHFPWCHVAGTDASDDMQSLGLVDDTNSSFDKLVFADQLGAVCGVHAPPPPAYPPTWMVPESMVHHDDGVLEPIEPSMYLFLPIASGWGCYKGEQPDEVDGYFRVPCVCKAQPDVDMAPAIELGMFVAIATLLLVGTCGIVWDNAQARTLPS